MTYVRPVLTPDWIKVSTAAAMMDVTPRHLVQKLHNRELIPLRVIDLDGMIRLNRHDVEQLAMLARSELSTA